MEPQFWRDRWAEGKIGFHEGKPNSLLARYIGELPGKHVLVPLCGKTNDLAFLAAHGKTVVGIELVEDAVRAFFAEHRLEPTVEGNRYSAAGVTIFAGDFFAVTREQVGPIEAIYDRAALVALPADLRTRYVAHLRTLAPGAAGLLVAIDYPQEKMDGPPFAVTDAEVHTHYPDAKQLGEQAISGSGRAAQLGVGIERAYRIAL